MVGTKPEKKKAKPKQEKKEKKCTHPLVADLEKMLPKGYTVKETEGYYTVFKGKEAVAHARNNLSGDYLSFRIFPSPTVVKPRTLEELQKYVTEMTTPKETEKKTGKGQ